jgi:hypothetical protein
MTISAQAGDFDIGKAIFDQLKELPPERQQRVLRWVSEALGMTVSTNATQSLQVVGAQNPPILPQDILPPGSPTTDIKTFVTSKSPKNDQQFAAAVAYFYRFEAPLAQRRDSIDGPLLQEATRLVGRNRLSTPLNTLNNAKKAGYLDGAAPGEFVINSVGENLVAMTLPSNVEIPKQKTKKKEKTG